MSTWALRISIARDAGQTPIEEIGLRFWVGGMLVCASGLSTVWCSESMAPSEASFFLFFVFEPPHMKLPTITWSHTSFIWASEKETWIMYNLQMATWQDRARSWVPHPLSPLWGWENPCGAIARQVRSGARWRHFAILTGDSGEMGAGWQWERWVIWEGNMIFIKIIN